MVMGIPTPYRYLRRHTHFHALHRSSRYGFTHMERSPTTLGSKTTTESADSVLRLAPINRRCGGTRLVSCYALFEWWLLLSQHPSCLGISTSFNT